MKITGVEVEVSFENYTVRTIVDIGPDREHDHARAVVRYSGPAGEHVIRQDASFTIKETA